MMKYTSYIIPIFLTVALISCYRDEPVNKDENGKENPLTDARGIMGYDEYSKNIIQNERFNISSQRAAQLALEYVPLFDEDKHTRSQTEGTITLSSSEPAKTIREVISVTDDNTTVMMAYSLEEVSTSKPDTLVHIVSFADNQGYAIMSTDVRDGALIAYSNEGNFNIADTVGNDILAFHIDMILGYAKARKAKKYEAEALGTDYFGDMEITVTDESDHAIMSSGMSGSGNPGLPGGGSGLPGWGVGTNCVDLPNMEWKGNEDAIVLAKRNYGGSGCFGQETPPPQIYFQPGPAGWLGPGTECVSTPYCYPPVYNYDTYYRDYGCYMHTWRSFKYDASNPVIEYGPYTDTAWHQKKPLNQHCNGYKYNVGCAALALLQIFNYFEKPTHYYNTVTSPTNYLKSGIPAPASYIYSEDMMINNIPRDEKVEDLAKFVRQLGKDMGMEYLAGGSGPPGLATSMHCIENTLNKYNYRYEYSDQMYTIDSNFDKIRLSLKDGKLVFIYGFKPIVGNIPWYFGGHCWIIDGYRRLSKGSEHKEFRVDEWGNFNSTKKYTTAIEEEYISNNYGDGQLSSGQWVLRGVYNDWDGYNFSVRLRFISGIEPK